MKRFTLLWAIVAAWVVSACVRDTAFVTMVPLPQAQSTNSLAPNLFVAGDSLFMSWLQTETEQGTSLWCSRWDGSTWTDPWSASSGERWVASDLDLPSVLVHPAGTAAAWLERIGGSRHAYGVKVAWLRQERPAPDPAWLHTDTSECEHGFASFVSADSLVQAVWLDGRETLAGGATTLRTAHLSPDGQIQDETVLDPRVCDCCPTASVRCTDGSLVVAYRDRSPEDVRDISIVRLADGEWSAPRTVNRDEWKIAGCPVNGPALAASDSLLALAWFALSGGVDPSVQVVFSRNSGESFGAPIRVDRRHAEGRVDVTFLADGRALVVWLETSDSASILWARPVAASGAPDSARIVTEALPGGLSGIPTVVARGRDVVVAWTESGDAPRVRTATLRF